MAKILFRDLLICAIIFGHSLAQNLRQNHDSAKQNLASSFVNAFVNCGFGTDKLLADEGRNISENFKVSSNLTLENYRFSVDFRKQGPCQDDRRCFTRIGVSMGF